MVSFGSGQAGPSILPRISCNPLAFHHWGRPCRYLQREEFVPFFRGPNVATEYLHNQRMLAKRLLQAGEPASQTPKDIPFSDLLAHKLMNI